MSRAPQRFRQRDVSATVKALRAAGVSIGRVDVGENGVSIVPGEPSSRDQGEIDRKVSEIDEMLRKSRARARKKG